MNRNINHEGHEDHEGYDLHGRGALGAGHVLSPDHRLARWAAD